MFKPPEHAAANFLKTLRSIFDGLISGFFGADRV